MKVSTKLPLEPALEHIFVCALEIVGKGSFAKLIKPVRFSLHQKLMVMSTIYKAEQSWPIRLVFWFDLGSVLVGWAPLDLDRT